MVRVKGGDKRKANPRGKKRMSRGTKTGLKSRQSKNHGEYPEDQESLGEQQNSVEPEDDDAPEEMPADKIGAGFIPLKSKKRKRKAKRSADDMASGDKAQDIKDSETEEQQAAKKARPIKKFEQKVPGHYFGAKKTEAAKFRIIDLSSGANNPSSSHRHAIELKNHMFSRHRRVTGTEYLGLLHKSKMVGKG